MGRHEAPPLRMKVENGRLVPATAYDQERLFTYQNGAELQVSLWQGRNAKLSRKYWAILHRVVADLPCPWQNAEEANDALKLALGITDIGKTIHDKWFIRPGSVSFSNMDEGKFRDFFEKAMALLEKITGVDPLTLHAESADVGEDEPQSAADLQADGGSGPNPPTPTAAANPSAHEAEQSEAGASGNPPPPEKAVHGEQSAPASDIADARECIAKLMAIVTDRALSREDAAAILGESADLWLGRLRPERKSFVTEVFQTCRKVLKGELASDKATLYLDSIVGDA